MKRVAIDCRVLGTEAALRGMGRYTQQQIFEALQLDKELELFLVVREKLDPTRCLHDWASMPRIHPITLDEGSDGATPGVYSEHEALTRYSARLQATLHNIGADLYHNATPFIHYGPYATALTRTPTVSTCYDLIPLIFPSSYFEAQAGRETYYRMLKNLRASTRVAAISLSAATDLRLYTGFSNAQIDITYPVVEAAFRLDRVDADRRAAAKADLAASDLGLPERFILSVTGVHRSKNAQFLLDSFTAARERKGWSGLPLVIVLPAAWALDVFRKQFRLPPDVILLADVPETSLRDLYVAAEFVFQPSLYEGFGYPVAEAMHCGAAVIATRTASIPEIAGDAAILLGPSDLEAGSDAIFRLATDTRHRDALRAAAWPQGKKFGLPELLGATTLDCWRKAAATATDHPRSRIALWSSMPPLDCGIADYTAELADHLAQDHEVDIYTDGSYMPSPRSAPNIHFRNVCDFDPAEPGLLDSVFQLQVREYQAFLFPALLRHGGTVMLHDTALGAGTYILMDRARRFNEFEDRIVAVEGPEAATHLGEAIMRCGGRLDLVELKALVDRHPMLRWTMVNGNRALAHTSAMANDLLRRYPDARIGVVRQGYGDRLPNARHLPLATWRLQLGVQSGLVVGVFGIVADNKRVLSAIEAFERLWQAYPDSLLLIIGRSYDTVYAAEVAERIRKSAAGARIIMKDYAPPAVFHALIALSDVLINLRWPSLGGVSAVLLRGLAAGKPMIVSDIEDWRELGAEACLRVPHDDAEVDAMACHLLALAISPSMRERMRQAARKWYAENGTVAVMAADYLRGGRPAEQCSGGNLGC